MERNYAGNDPRLTFLDKIARMPLHLRGNDVIMIPGKDWRDETVSSSTKESLAAALKQMMSVKPIGKITVKDLVEICGVNRQTFYYHFDDVYDLLEWVFEEDANRFLPQKVVYEHWREDIMIYLDYLQENSTFALNVYNSNSRLYMLRYLEEKMEGCIRSFAEIVSEGQNIDRQDFEFVVKFYSKCAIGLISQWMDLGMQLPKEITVERILKVMDGSVERYLSHFEIKK